MISASKEYYKSLGEYNLVNQKLIDARKKLKDIEDQIKDEEQNFNKIIEDFIYEKEYELDEENNIHKLKINKLKKNIDIIIEFIAKLNNYSKNLLDELKRIKQKTYERNFHYYYYPILVELKVYQTEQKFYIKNYNIYPFTYLNTLMIPLITSKCNKFEFYILLKEYVENIDFIETISRYYRKRFNYFLQSLIINLLYLDNNIVIRGGFVRDLILKDSKNNIIDIDMYMPENIFNSLLNTIYIDSETLESYNTFHYILNSLSKLILGESIKLKSICLYNNIASILDKKCIKMIFEIENKIITFDINYNSKSQFCNSELKNMSIDFIMNSLELSFIDDKLKISLYSDNEYITKKLKKFDDYDFDITNNKLILNIINEMVDPVTKVINLILKRKTFLCHDICTDNINCDSISCERCYNIKRKMRNRYNKFKSSFEVDIERCSKKYCIYDALIEKDIFDEKEEDLIIQNIRIEKPYCRYRIFPI